MIAAAGSAPKSSGLSTLNAMIAAAGTAGSGSSAPPATLATKTMSISVASALDKIVRSSPLAASIPLGISAPPLPKPASFLETAAIGGGVNTGGSIPIAYTQGQADAAASKVPVTLIAAGVGALAVGAFVLLQLRKKR
jgi:hypothetical protein